MEKIIHSRMMHFFDINNIFSPYQYGFRSGRSTQQAIFDFTKLVYSSLNHKKIIGFICLDVAKAFDSINHDILLHKLSHLGFNRHAITWFRSYLTRTQVVKFGPVVSHSLSFITGSGQGTIIGPLLFIFYINDIISCIKTLKINMYADDCILYTSGNDWNKRLQKIQPEMNDVQFWCTANKLKLNVSKSMVLIITSRHKLGKIDYSNEVKMGNQSLQFTDKYKYLGVMLDCEMNLTSLLSDVKKTVSSRLFNLRKLRHYIT